MFVFKAAVVGAGVMGGEIAQVIASADIPVLLKDVKQEFVDKGLEKAREVTQGQAAKLVKREKLTQEQADAQIEHTLGLITGTTDYDDFGDVDFVIEAVPEKMAIKHQVFADLDAATPGHAILASNTSGLSITEIGDITNRPDKVVGFHFFWPASYMRLIEVIEGEETSPETVQAAANFAQAIRKMPVRCARVPGLRRQPHPRLDGVGDLALPGRDRDRRRGHRQGAHRGQARADGAVPPRRHVGPRHRAEGRARTCATPTATASTSTRAWRSSSSRATSARRAERASMSTPETAPAVDEALAERFQLKAFVESCLVLEEGIAGVRDIDLGMMMGTGMIPGPFARADFRGLDEVLAALEKAEDEWGEHFEPPLILRRLVAQGRLGAKSGQGFYPYPQPDEGYENAAVKLDTRGEYAIVWLDNPPANSISPDVIEGLGKAWAAIEADPDVKAMILASPEPGAVLRGRRHQGVHEDGRGRRVASCSTARTTCCARGSSRAR